jgi:hypothetical protein
VVGWKSGFRALKDRYFRHNRKDIFRYVVFAHALGLASPPPATPATPRSTSGIADLPGGDALITLGLWRSDNIGDDQVGSVEQQAGTLIHELGHTLGLRHAGIKNTPGCQPNYQCSMNYLFQARGLLRADGTKTVVDFSRKALPSLTEGSLLEANGIGNDLYRARWYAPPGPVDKHLAQLGAKFATRHCDGSPVGPGEPPFVKVESSGVGGFIDWNNDGFLTPNSIASDINFSGALEAAYAGTDDWSAVDLQQVGARRNARGLSGDIASGDIASGDIASGDIASGDIASGDIASGDIAQRDRGSTRYRLRYVQRNGGCAEGFRGDDNQAGHRAELDSAQYRPGQGVSCVSRCWRDYRHERACLDQDFDWPWGQHSSCNNLH